MSAVKNISAQEKKADLIPAGRLVFKPAPANTNTKMDLAEIIINPPVISVANGMARIASEIQIGGETKILWFEIDEAFKSYLADDTLDSFVAASLIPAILRGENIRLKGPMSAKLYYNISYSLIPILCDFLEKPQMTYIIPDSFTSHVSSGTGVAAGFSGGIDSFCNYYDHSPERVPDEFSLTHFLFNNVGAHGQHGLDTDRSIFHKRFSRLMECAKKLGKPAVAVDSNLDEFMGQKFELTHTLRNTTVALLMQKEFGKFMYSSGCPLSETKLGPDLSMSRLEPVILPLLSTERLECIASGGRHSRVEKTRRVTEIEESRHYLDVCVQPHSAPAGIANCGVCWKCIRTATTLKIFGKLEEYNQIFDLKSFARFDKIYLIEVMGGKSSYSKEIRQLIAERNYRIPSTVRFISSLLPGAVAQQFSIRVIPALRRHKYLARFVNGCLAW